MRVIDVAWACLRRDFRIDASYKVSFVIDVVDALVLVLAYAVLARLFPGRTFDGFTPLGFVLVGVAANGALMTALVAFAQAVRGVQAAGAIKAVLVTPAPPLLVVLLSSVYPLLRATLDLVVWLVAAVWLGAPLAGLAPAPLLAAAVVFALAALAMAGFGFLSAAFAVIFKRGDPVVWLLGAISLLLGGVLYPASALPPALAALGRGLPTTHALEGMRSALLGGAGLAEVGGSVLALAGFAVIGMPLGLAALAWSIRHARREGTLGHV